MAERSSIAWTRSTFNPWIGCTKVGPGCDGCYAEALDARHRWKGATHWGVSVPRMRTSVSNWRGPLRWDRLAAEEQRTGLLTPGSDWSGRVGFWPVFCASLADVADNEIPHAWRQDLVVSIEATPHLSWLLVTKRISNFKPGMFPERWFADGFPANVRVLVTVVNQDEADRDVPKLLALPCKNGISYEPALSQIDWRIFLPSSPGVPWHGVPGWNDGPFLQWVIVGGESSQPHHPARRFDLAWARQAVQQCKAAGVPVFVKQLGTHPAEFGMRLHLKDRAGADLAEWPQDLQLQEFPT